MEKQGVFVPNNCHVQVFSYTSLWTNVLSKNLETQTNSQNQTIVTSAYVTWRSRRKRSISGSPTLPKLNSIERETSNDRRETRLLIQNESQNL